MKAKHDEKPVPVKAKYVDDKTISDLPGYPSYPEGEDIFNKFQVEQDLNPEDLSKIKEQNSENSSTTKNNLNESEDVSGNDLDVPGSELDDEQEEIGSEDEENNYYSLGGDDHNDLEENKS